MRCAREVPFVMMCLASLVPSTLSAADPCDGFSWDVSHERALFASSPRQVSAGRDAASAPQIEVNRLYQLALAPLTEVQLRLAPDRKPPADGTLAGILHLQVARAGLYRIALSEGDWIDVMSAGAVIASQDHVGRPGCSAPHKVVQFAMPAGVVLIQLSAAANATVRLTITSAPVSPAAAR